MTKIISVKEVKMGYCQLCETAAPVGEIKLKDWHHSALICSSCLTEMGKEIANKTYQLVTELSKNT